ncbi:VWA domain-containing protein [uncultured Planktosalinus sp.]|uniref:VWA domain-containing protein n=1 Tax=uncultured Planktosalinus sp. TaxID=1810935 RepID=UPI0030DDC8BB
MHEDSLFYIILAVLVAISIASYFYGYKSKLSIKLRWYFGALRFLSVFILLLLLINPKFYNTTQFNEKPGLAVLVDNSESVKYLEKSQETQNAVSFFKNNEALQSRFDIDFYSFGENLRTLDSLSFTEKQTKLSQPLLSLNEVYKNKVTPIVLLTDGNQTFGDDYEFVSHNLSQPIYPVILGDTTTYKDVSINRINVNRYTYLNNEFPVEVFLLYSGNTSETTIFTVKKDGLTVYQQTVNLNESQSSQVLNFTLPANRVGVQKYTAEIGSLTDEKNSSNNQNVFAVEVIDQATNILLVSDIVHPDIGALKKAISSNEQRKITVENPNEALKNITDFQLVILYQPTSRFGQIFEEIDRLNLNAFIIAGSQTNWTFLNRVQNNFNKTAYSTEEVQGVLNTAYSLFSVDDIGFNNLPPLKSSLGDLTFKGAHEVLLKQQILDITTENALLSTYESGTQRFAFLDAENIWKWRSNIYVKNGSFRPFDDFINNLVQYLSSDKNKTRLDVEAESFYYNNGDIKIKAQFFDKNYEFNNRASLNITVKNNETQQSNTFPLLLKSNFYEVNLSNLEPGEYSYTVSVTEEPVNVSGSFSVLEFNVEQQFLNADVNKLSRLSTATNGAAYFIENFTELEQDLLNDRRYTTIEKSEQKIVTLLDWKILLFILIALLAIEWFSRKYFGLI